jgi:lipopolysaccharide export system protein LptC
MNFRSPWVITLIVVLAILSSWFAWQLQKKDEIKPGGPPRSDYVLHEFQMVTLNENGKEAFRLTAPYLERDPQGKSITITAPLFSFPDKKGGQWHAKSTQAWVGPGANEVRLLQNVEMTGPSNKKGESTQFKTEELTVMPKKNTASAQELVTITRGSSILEGHGLRVDMQSKRFQLLANVKGRYAPSRR